MCQTTRVAGPMTPVYQVSMMDKATGEKATLVVVSGVSTCASASIDVPYDPNKAGKSITIGRIMRVVVIHTSSGVVAHVAYIRTSLVKMIDAAIVGKLPVVKTSLIETDPAGYHLSAKGGTFLVGVKQHRLMVSVTPMEDNAPSSYGIDWKKVIPGLKNS